MSTKIQLFCASIEVPTFLNSLVIVVLPNSHSLTFKIELNTRGSELLAQVCNKLQIIERNYFSFKIKRNGKLFWINLRNAISEECFKPTIKLYFHVKFFVVSHLLSQVPTRRMFYHDIVHTLTTRKYGANPDTNFAYIIALIAQIEIGSCKDSMEFDLKTYYVRILVKLEQLSPTLLRRKNSNNSSIIDTNLNGLLDIGDIDVSRLIKFEERRISQIIHEHRKLGDIHPDEAIGRFLQEAPKIACLTADYFETSLVYEDRIIRCVVGVTADRLVIKTKTCRAIKFTNICEMYSRLQFFKIHYWNGNEKEKIKFKFDSNYEAQALYRSIAEKQAFYGDYSMIADLEHIRLIRFEIFPWRALTTIIGITRPEVYMFDIPKSIKDFRDQVSRDIFHMKNQLGRMPIQTIEPLTSECDDDDEEKEQQFVRKQCVICFENEVSIAFVPCGHVVCCEKCSQTLDDCPFCRVNIQHKQKIYL